jgi:glycosyltransferase involved in cell wall biosynthesis
MAIRDAAARRMPERPQHALVIPLSGRRCALNGEWGVSTARNAWKDSLHAAIVRREVPTARFVIIVGPDAFMPEYADELRALVAALGLGTAVAFLGARPDVPRLLAGLDVLAWLARGERMPHVIAEAGAARLPVVATRDNGTTEQIVEGYSGLFVPHEDPPAVAAAFRRFLDAPALR